MTYRSLVMLALVFSFALPRCNCASEYPKHLPEAAPQRNALNLRIGAELIERMRANLEAILRKNFEVDATGEFVIIYLPEASDASASSYCDESGTQLGIPRCAYNVRLRDGCIGPGEQDAQGKCQPNLGRPRETMRSSIKIRIADLASHMRLEMEEPGFLVNGGFRLILENLPIGVDLGLYAKLPAIQGNTLGDFACRYFSPPETGQSLMLQKIDVSIQPRVDNIDGTAKFFATTVTRDLQLGELALRAEEVPDPACLSLSGADLPCSAACPLLDSVIGPVADGFNFINDLLKPALPYIVTPIANALLAFMWGDQLEFTASIPVSEQSFIPKDAGRDVSLIMSAQAGAFAVTDRGGPDARQTRGMSFPMSLGAYADLSPCVSPTPPPQEYASGAPPQLDGMMQFQHPQAAPGVMVDEPYHAAVSISESFMNQVAYALRNSGLLCVSLGSEPGGLLASGAFVPNAGLLYLLAPPLAALAPGNAPIFFRINPGSAPSVRFGSGEQTGTAPTGEAIRDSLITMTLFNTGIEFHLFAWDRYIRTFALSVDIVVGMTMYPTTAGKLMISIDTIKADNIIEQFNELMPNYDFSRITEVLFAILSTQLNSRSLSFEVPVTQALKDALGAPELGMHILDVRREGTAGDYLNAYAKFCSPDDEADPGNLGCYDFGAPSRSATRVTQFARQVEPGAVYEAGAIAIGAVRADRTPSGRVKLQVEAPDGGDVSRFEFQVGVDSETFGPFLRPNNAGEITIAHPLLRVLGKHRLAVRSKGLGRPFDPASAVAWVEVLVDPEQPRVSVSREAGRRVILAEDLVTPADKLSFSVVSGDANSDWMSLTEASEYLNASAEDAWVIARDEAGNLSHVLPSVDASSVTTSAGCNTTGSGASGGEASWLALLLASVFTAAARRGRRSKLARQP